jgi:two-component system NtrC family response regulator
MSKKQNILIADDDETILRSLEYHLGRAGYSTLSAGDGLTALRIAREENPEIVITDLRMPGKDGLELVSELSSERPRCVIIVITAHGTIETAVQAMKLGAFDFITKPFGRDDILRVVDKAGRVQDLIRENIHLRSLALERYHFDRLVTVSENMRKLIETANRAANSESTILISGESGTGKELLAKAIHFSSPRSEGPFFAVNVGGIPTSLIDSELFGHKKGAFTGAVESRKGAFEEANGGTLFLDEIGELAPEVQVKLLRVLQEREYSRLGESKLIHTNARIVSVTNKDLEMEVREGRFREDLYYRLCVIPLSIPPLRHRRNDIPLLIQHFVERVAANSNRDALAVDPDVIEHLSLYDWPGNVRQLENLVERLVTLNMTGTIRMAELPVNIRTSGSTVHGLCTAIPDEGISLEEVEKGLLAEAMERCEYNQSKAAQFLRITRNTLLYRLDKYKLPKKK